MARRFKLADPSQLLDRLSITYERKGDTLWASCPHPDHNDSSPSWRMVDDVENPKHGQHRCYGCGWGGWPIHLCEAVLGCSRDEARAWLRDITKAPPMPFAVEVQHTRGLQPAFMMPPGVFTKPFHEWPKAPKEYARERGLLEWQVQRWDIGYTVGRYDADKNPLAGRIVFPVKNLGHDLIGYTGRSYTGSERRYKEPSKREGADLGAVFGEEHWHKRRRVVAVTEGAIDALAVERCFPYSLDIAGIYGSQLHQGHVSRLSTFEYVLMCTDSDNAGNKVVKALEEQLRRWTTVLRVELPEGEDPGSLSVNNPQVLKDALTSCLRVVHGDRNRSDVEERPRARRRRTEVRLARK